MQVVYHILQFPTSCRWFNIFWFKRIYNFQSPTEEEIKPFRIIFFFQVLILKKSLSNYCCCVLFKFSFIIETYLKNIIQVFKAAQPALLYLVPFTLLPLLTMAWLKVVKFLLKKRKNIELQMITNNKNVISGRSEIYVVRTIRDSATKQIPNNLNSIL